MVVRLGLRRCELVVGFGPRVGAPYIFHHIAKKIFGDRYTRLPESKLMAIDYRSQFLYVHYVLLARLSYIPFFPESDADRNPGTKHTHYE